MYRKKDYEIAFVGLTIGNHTYEYKLGKSFFEVYKASQFFDSNITVTLTLQKNAGFLQLKFEVGGTVAATCDRCGNDVQVQLWDEFNMIVKLVENPQQMNETEEDADIYYLARTESHLFVADWLYEFVALSLPHQIYCENLPDGQSGCNQEVLEKLQALRLESEDEPSVNPIWKALEKLKDKK
ncbi:MAG: DUF177 domain-containing protein [Bacteroidetes bacterium]|nr:MAG: DUF177 domain-containing protein [Bacteroidota bacterium]TAF92997.1 MAG: DUF177 domain-containing protein [Bacteroidota bacterium]